MYICIARVRKNTSNALSTKRYNNRQTGGFSESVETVLVQQLQGIAQAVNFLTLNISKMAGDTAIVTMEGE